MVTPPQFERHLNMFGIRRDMPGKAPAVRVQPPHCHPDKRGAAQGLADAAQQDYCDFWGLDPRVQWALAIGWVTAVRADAEMLQRAGGENAPKLWQVQASSLYNAAGILNDPEGWGERVLEGINHAMQDQVADKMSRVLRTLEEGRCTMPGRGAKGEIP